MYSSPSTPTGTGWSSASRTYSSVLASGRPMGTVTASSDSASTACHAANVVLSVGPYALTNFPGAPFASTARAAPGSTASPPTWS
ncbi:hypothetical protein COSO111634_19380 [Corallococcus soli]